MITGYIEGYYGVELSWKERDSIISKTSSGRMQHLFLLPERGSLS